MRGRHDQTVPDVVNRISDTTVPDEHEHTEPGEHGSKKRRRGNQGTKIIEQDDNPKSPVADMLDYEGDNNNDDNMETISTTNIQSAAVQAAVPVQDLGEDGESGVLFDIISTEDGLDNIQRYIDSEDRIETADVANDIERVQTQDDAMNVMECVDLFEASTCGFLNHFSRRNDTSLSGYNWDESTPRLSGGSRDAPMRKFFECRFKHRGCDRTNAKLDRIEAHEQTRRKREGTVLHRGYCEDPVCGCRSAFESPTVKGLLAMTKAHYEEARWRKQVCGGSGLQACKTIFQTSAQLNKHRLKFHPAGWVARICPADFSHEEILETPKDMRAHLRNVHGMGKDEIDWYMSHYGPNDRQLSVQWERVKCPEDENHIIVWNSRPGLEKHLSDVHGLGDG